MATFRNRKGKWQARIQVKNYVALSKTFINKANPEKWAKKVKDEIQKGSYANRVLDEQTTFAEMIECYIVDFTHHAWRKDRLHPFKGTSKTSNSKTEEARLTPQKIAQHSGEYLKEIAAATVMRKLSYFFNHYTYSYRMGYQ